MARIAAAQYNLIKVPGYKHRYMQHSLSFSFIYISVYFLTHEGCRNTVKPNTK